MNMNTTITEQIRIWGIVQGVGFRPFVAKLARDMRMKGWVRNLGGLVEIVLTDTPERVETFLSRLKDEKPGPAEIVHVRRNRLENQEFSGFAIRQSGEDSEDDGGKEPVMIPADLALCPDCLEELRTPENRRHAHPFISCMACGPRYTIIRKVPYDRENTAMELFPMCPQCSSEYEDILDRRHHAQTVSCHDCGPQIRIFPPIEEVNHWAEHAAEVLKEGYLIAFKAMGGYHLMADPANPESIARLRKVKQREQKPFAVLFEDIETLSGYCRISPEEEALLTSSARPILLLERRPESPKLPEDRLSRFIGAFLPSLGGQILLLDAFGGPLVATSANPSGLPIITEDREIKAMMDAHPEIRAMFFHDRPIDVSVDDSVVRVIDGQPQMIRRSKGYTPVPLYVEEVRGQILVAGPQLKNAFALNKGPYVYVSQFFGDLDSVEMLSLYRRNLERFREFFDIHPQAVACDLHPLYETTAFAAEYARIHGIPLVKVQHHHAHVASVMAEHNLKGAVLGVSLDGTGYGTDGKIWGGEFLLCEGGTFERKAHLRYVPMIGGDSSIKDAAKSAICIGYALSKEKGEPKAPGIVPDISEILDYAWAHGTLGDTGQEDVVRKALAHGINTIESSSMGRWFDAVAAMLGICSYNTYEGQCAMLLEDAAARALAGSDSPADMLALAFHREISRMILGQCLEARRETGTTQIALTGGVFQNRILMEETLGPLRANGFQPYYNISVSPNDGGIALGQLYVASMTINKE